MVLTITTMMYSDILLLFYFIMFPNADSNALKVISHLLIGCDTFLNFGEVEPS